MHVTDNTTLQAVHLSKCYRIYEKPSHRLFQMLRFGHKQYFREFWALKDVSFSIERGETVGIIGRNGSGKSTLLQIVCQTLMPTSGAVESHGRIAALLELGTGFNPEFTGRDNVFLAASLHGLSSDEIRGRFDRIAAFADIGDFIDQPVKTYSSGMHVRLAFAVIAHVDADILVIDEALAVGDAVFTQKCMRYLRAFRETGTLLFVSHDMAAVLNLCQKTIWIDHGELRMIGSAAEVTKAYMQDCLQEVTGVRLESATASVRVASVSGVEMQGVRMFEGADTVAGAPRVSLEKDVAENAGPAGPFGWGPTDQADVVSEGFGTGAALISRITLTDLSGTTVNVLAGGELLTLRIEAKVHSTLASAIVGFFVKDRLGQCLFGEHTYTHVQPPLAVQAGETVEASFRFRLPLLPDGDYVMTVSIADGDPWHNVQHHWLHDAHVIRVSSKKLRYGLVGIPFEEVEMRKL